MTAGVVSQHGVGAASVAHLAQEVDERALSERICDGGVEGKGGRLLAQVAEPRRRNTGRDQIALVQQEDKVLVARLLLDEGLGVRRTRAKRVPRVENFYHHITRVDDLPTRRRNRRQGEPQGVSEEAGWRAAIAGGTWRSRLSLPGSATKGDIKGCQGTLKLCGCASQPGGQAQGHERQPRSP